MRVRPTSRAIWAVSFPLIVVGVFETVVEITDTIFLGRYGVTELGAVGLADAIYEMLVVAAVGLVDGMQVVMSRRAGRGSARGVGRAFNQGLYLLALAALAIFAAVRWGGPLMTAAFVPPGDVEVRRAADGFLRVVALGVFFDAMNLAWFVFYLSLSRTRVLLGATAVLAASNVALGWCLIFGNLGAPRLGIEGAAAASVASEFAACAFLTLYAWRRGDVRRHGLFAFRRWDGALSRVLVRVSGPVVLEALVETARWVAFFALIGQLGRNALAGANVLYCCYLVLLVPVEAFAETACSMTGNLIGQGSPSRIRVLLRRAASLAYAVTLPLMVLAVVFPEQALWVFTDDPGTIEENRLGVFFVAGAFLVGIPAEVLVGAVTGTGDTKGALVIEVVMGACVLLLCYAAAAVLRLPAEYVWLSLPAGWALRLVLARARLRRQVWRDLHI